MKSTTPLKDYVTVNGFKLIEDGFSKGTLHHMKKKARSEKPFTLNAHVKERLESW